MPSVWQLLSMNGTVVFLEVHGLAVLYLVFGKL